VGFTMNFLRGEILRLYSQKQNRGSLLCWINEKP